MSSTAPTRRRRCSIWKIPGYRYSRIANPTVDILEKRVAMLEGGVACLATASGQAALSTALLNVADDGGSIVAPPQLYGTTHTLLAHTLRRHGVEARFAKSDAPQDIAALIDGHDARGVLRDASAIPPAISATSRRFAKIAHDAGVPLIVDNTVATPILLRPIDFGADIVVHSLTKFMGGHGVAMGGAIVDAGRFDWRACGAVFRRSASRTNPITASSTPTVSALRPISRAPAASINARPAPCSRR